MISRLFQQLLNSCGVVFRTIKAFFSRQIMGIQARFRRITSFSRQAAKMVPKAMSTVAVAGKKPTKREDFVETKRLFVSKSFIILILVGIVGLGLLAYFVIWPWLVSLFFTAHLYKGEEKTASYNGRAVVYYDEEKHEPMLAGKLEEGILQGSGKSYDTEGLVVYTGMYANGLYDGRGSLYEDGFLVYEGDFSMGSYHGSGVVYDNGITVYEGGFVQGLYEGFGKEYEKGALAYSGLFAAGERSGAGKEYAKDGSVSFEGTFAAGKRDGAGSEYTDGVLTFKGSYTDGLRDGLGSEYYEDGVLCYRGEYAAGERSGEGSAFYEDGQLMYKGGFSNSLYEGEGSLYGESGALVYTGGFSQGLYEGAGKLTADGMTITSEFAAGVPTGTAVILKNGTLYYEGQIDGVLPHGIGTLYSQSGTPIYTGAVDKGSPDGYSLLMQSADVARASFAQATTVETPGTRAGFSITNEDLGMTLFLSYKTEDSDPTVYYVYTYESGADEHIAPMRWRNEEQYESENDTSAADKQVVTKRAEFTGSVPFPSGTLCRTSYDYDDYTFVGWSTAQGEDWFMTEWLAGDDMPAPTGAEEGGAGSESRLDSLLSELSVAGDSASAAPAIVEKNSYTGSQEPIDAIEEPTALSIKDKSAVMAAMADYSLAAETRSSKEEQLVWMQAGLDKALEAYALGNADDATVKAAEEDVAAVKLAISKATVDMEKAKAEASLHIATDLGKIAVSEVMFVVDPSKIELQELLEAVPENERDVKLVILDMELAYQQLVLDTDAYKAASTAASDAETAFAMGTITDDELVNARLQKSDAAVKVNEDICACTKLFLDLVRLTDGYAARSLGYMDGVFEEVPVKDEPTDDTEDVTDETEVQGNDGAAMPVQAGDNDGDSDESGDFEPIALG